MSNSNVGGVAGFVLSSTISFLNINLPLCSSYLFIASTVTGSPSEITPSAFCNSTSFVPFGKFTSSTLYFGASSVANHLYSCEIYVSSAPIETSYGS